MDKYWLEEILGVLTGGKVVGDDVGGDISCEHHFKAREGEVAHGSVVQNPVLVFQRLDCWGRGR